MRARAIPFAVGAWFLLAGVIVQALFAGMGLFELTDWTNHRGLGWGLSLVSLLLPPLALASGVRRGTLGLALLLTVAAIVQPELALARLENPVVAALHPVNALLVFWLAWLSARASLRELRRADRPAAAPAPASAPAAAPIRDPAATQSTNGLT